MRTPCFHTCLAFILKFLNFLQAFVGVAIIVISSYMLNQWQHHHHDVPPPSPLNVASAVVSVQDDSIRFNFDSLPSPWFIYAFMGVGVLICCISFIGHIGAEAINGCCLCCYAVLAVFFILLEVGLVTFIAIDRQWEKDIPYDSTGDLDSLRKFIEDNADVFKWVGIAIIALQVLSVVLATILRSLVSRPRADDDDDIDEEYAYRTREPLLSPYNQASGSTRGDSDIWSSRMRAKYGLSGGDPKPNSPTQPQIS